MIRYDVSPDNYFCVVNGIYVKKVDPNRKPIMRECLKWAKKGAYTEIWYCYSSGRQRLLDYWN